MIEWCLKNKYYTPICQTNVQCEFSNNNILFLIHLKGVIENKLKLRTFYASSAPMVVTGRKLKCTHFKKMSSDKKQQTT